MVEVSEHIQSVVTDFTKERLDTITKAKPGINQIVLTDEEREVFRLRSEDTASVYIGLAGERGKELLEAFKSEIATSN